MTGFEPRIDGVGSDRSTKYAATTNGCCLADNSGEVCSSLHFPSELDISSKSRIASSEVVTTNPYLEVDNSFRYNSGEVSSLIHFPSALAAREVVTNVY